MKVFGIDIVKGSVRSRSRRPQYALVTMEDGEITGETTVSGFRLERLLHAAEPEILAVDSIQEIAADTHELFAFLQSLPPATRLVQVTGGEKKESLGKVAARFNLKFNRFDPFDEARTIARVASLGWGAEVIAFENSCDLIVSRRRSVGKGGWSQNRYVRKVHGAVQQRGREIESALKEAGLRFTKKEQPAYGGASRVQFHICAPRDMVPVRTERGPDVQVRIAGRRLDRIRYRPLHGRPRHLIVGIDPGTTTGIAALDLDGNVVVLTSARQMSMSDVIEELYRAGKPLVIASDVAQMPYSVEKIRRSFSAVPYTPRQDRKEEEKVEATAPFGPANDHERDALFAALEAYRFYKNKFANIAKRVPPGIDLDEVRAGVVRGMSIEQVLGELSRPAPSAVSEEPPPVGAPAPTPQDERLLQLDGTVKKLRTYIEELKSEIETKDTTIGALESRLARERTGRDRELRRDGEVAKREAQIASLKKRLRKEEKRARGLAKRVERLRRFADLQMGGEHVPVKVLDAFTRDGIRALDDDLGIGEGDVIYTARTSGWGRSAVQELCETGIRAFIVGEVPDERLASAFRDCKVPLLHLPVQVRGRTATVEHDRLTAAIEAWKQEQQAFLRRQKEELLTSIVQEYRSEREREVRRHG